MRPLVYALLLAFSLAPRSQADSLGRLFFSPEQRAHLEYNRAHPAIAKEDAAPAVLRVLRVNGIVQKHGGTRIVWVNGVAQDTGKSGEQAPDALAVAMPGKPQSFRVKVGQALLLDGVAVQSQVTPAR